MTRIIKAILYVVLERASTNMCVRVCMNIVCAFGCVHEKESMLLSRWVQMEGANENEWGQCVRVCLARLWINGYVYSIGFPFRMMIGIAGSRIDFCCRVYNMR